MGAGRVPGTVPSSGRSVARGGRRPPGAGAPPQQPRRSAHRGADRSLHSRRHPGRTTATVSRSVSDHSGAGPAPRRQAAARLCDREAAWRPLRRRRPVPSGLAPGHPAGPGSIAHPAFVAGGRGSSGRAGDTGGTRLRANRNGSDRRAVEDGARIRGYRSRKGILEPAAHRRRLDRARSRRVERTRQGRALRILQTPGEQARRAVSGRVPRTFGSVRVLHWPPVCGLEAGACPVLPELLRIPTKSSTRSERSRPAVPGQAVHPFRVMPSGFER